MSLLGWPGSQVESAIWTMKGEYSMKSFYRGQDSMGEPAAVAAIKASRLSVLDSQQRFASYRRSPDSPAKKNQRSLSLLQ